MAEHTVELVEVALVLHQRGAGEIVERLDPPRREVALHRLHQCEIFAQRHRYAGRFQRVEEGDEHRYVLGPSREHCMIRAPAAATRSPYRYIPRPCRGRATVRTAPGAAPSVRPIPWRP